MGFTDSLHGKHFSNFRNISCERFNKYSWTVCGNVRNTKHHFSDERIFQGGLLYEANCIPLLNSTENLSVWICVENNIILKFYVYCLDVWMNGSILGLQLDKLYYAFKSIFHTLHIYEMFFRLQTYLKFKKGNGVIECFVYLNDK